MRATLINKVESIGDGKLVIYLSNDKKAIIDEEDYIKVGHIRWIHITSKGARRDYSYAMAVKTRDTKSITMNRLLYPNMSIKYKDGNSLNLCKENVSARYELISKFNKDIPGVSKVDHCTANISHDKKKICLGRYTSFGEAVHAREYAEKVLRKAVLSKYWSHAKCPEHVKTKVMNILKNKIGVESLLELHT